MNQSKAPTTLRMSERAQRAFMALQRELETKNEKLYAQSEAPTLTRDYVLRYALDVAYRALKKKRG